MKNAQPTEVRPSALDACLSIAIVANNPSTQQAFALLMTFSLRGVML